MNEYSRPSPKINPALGVRADGSPDDNDRVEIGPTAKAFAEWAELGLTAPNLERMRKTRLDRVVEKLHERDCGAVLLFDPLNIRYANDSSNMQLWTAHNPARACLVTATGYMVLWDFHGCDHLNAHLPLINELRHGAGFFYFLAGDAEEDKAREFAAQVKDLMRKHSPGNTRLAVDKIEVAGVHALEAEGFSLSSGQELMEHARVIKSIDEVNAMRCAMATTEIACQAMQDAMQPGMAEVELWAHMHAANIARGGEWIETRILSSGPRTNPWMQEAGARVMKAGELLAFDTDLIGPYGMCADISRTWLVGDGLPSGEQKALYQFAHEHIITNRDLLKPGVTFRELTEKGHRLKPEYVEQRYGVMMHGVGLCDEYPSILYPEDFIDGAFEYVLKPGMVMCVEAYIGEVGGINGVKLENQVLITDDGYEDLTSYAFDERLLG